MYKIIKDNRIIDVIKYADFVRFLPSGQVLRTSKDLAEGIVGSDYRTIYSFGSTLNLKADVVTLEKISQEEFNRLQGLLNSQLEVYSNKQLLDQAKELTIKNLSELCKNAITAGFTVKLSDGESYSFKLTSEDQINLLNFENQLNTGKETFVYHATDLPCKVFTRIDMAKIISAYRKHVLYHTTYFNVAKQYINSLTNIEKIKAFTYGTNIAGATKDSIIRQILLDGGTL
jgi:hypothetical protein